MPFQTILKQPESKTLEFKRDLFSPGPILKTLIAFANTAGGRLVIGVTDDKRLIGVDNPLDEEEKLNNLIADSISPRLVPNIELVTAEGKTLLVVEVFLSNSRPHWLNKEGSEHGVYVRLGSSNRQADPALVAELRRIFAEAEELGLPEPKIEEIARALGKQKPTRYLNDLMKKLLSAGLVAYTLPDKPNSRLQKYRLAPKGRIP